MGTSSSGEASALVDLRLVGGLLTVWYGPGFLAGRFGLPALAAGAGEAEAAG